MQPKIIRTEEEFLNFALSILDSNEEMSNCPSLRFQGWPKVDVRVSGTRYRQSLPSGLLAGLLTFQEEAKRAYCLAKYGTINLQKLTNDDKEIIGELVFTVSKGSTKSEGDADVYLSRFCEFMDLVLKGMTGKEKIAVVTVLAIAIGGGYIAHSYFENEAKVALAQEETKRLSTAMEPAKASIEALRSIALTHAKESLDSRGDQILERLSNGYSEVVKSVPDADELEFGGHKFSNQQIQKMAEPELTARASKEYRSQCFISGYKKYSQHLSVSVFCADLNQSFTIKADRMTLKEAEQSAILKALDASHSIELSFYATTVNGNVVSARLTNVTLS